MLKSRREAPYPLQQTIASQRSERSRQLAETPTREQNDGALGGHIRDLSDRPRIDRRRILRFEEDPQTRQPQDAVWNPDSARGGDSLPSRAEATGCLSQPVFTKGTELVRRQSVDRELDQADEGQDVVCVICVPSTGSPLAG